MYFLRRFRGLREYEESYMERDHQRGVQFERRSSNYKSYEDKADLHSCWERLRTNPRIILCENEHEAKREKRRQSQSVTDQREVNKRVKLEKREDALERNS